MKQIIFISTFLLLILTTYCQDSFKFEWKPEGNLAACNGIVDNEGNMVFVGSSNTADSGYNLEAYILKLDTTGEYDYRIISSGMDSSYAYIHLLQLPNGNYFVLGSEYPDSEDSSSQYQIVADIFDEELNLIKSNKYPPLEIYKKYGGFMPLLETDGNILAAGGAERREGSTMNRRDLALIRFNQEGDTLETKYAHYQRNVTVYDFKKIPSSENYLILEFITQGFGYFECYILKPDLTSDTINYFSSFDFSVTASHLCSDYWYPDKTFMMASCMHYTDNPYDDGLGVFRCDTLANISEHLFLNKENTSDFSAYLKCMAFADENSIYIAGWELDMLDCSNPDSIELYVVDTGLNQVAYKSLGGDQSYSVYGVLSAKNGDAVIFAKASHMEGEQCLSNLAVFYVSREDIGLPPIEVFNLDAPTVSPKVYPNPAKDIVNIKISKSKITPTSRIRLFNMNGKKIYDYKLPHQGNIMQLNISNLDKGVYVFEVIDKEKTITKGKFIKQ